jgi:uncharacterized protein YmfQ (DUF2313 family)
MPEDRHVRRDGDDYAAALTALLPWGMAWPRDDDSILMRTVRGLSQVFGFVDSRAADLLEIETDPRITREMLSDWERNFGLPDPCFLTANTIDQRHALLLFKMTLLGGQSRDFLIHMASLLGYVITITERAPFTCGISQVGDTSQMSNWNGTPGETPSVLDYRWRIGPPEIRFWWTVHVTNAPLLWFRAGVGQAGVDHHLTIGYATDLECLLRRFKPAHTDIVFDYSNLGNDDPMAGTP